VILGEAALSETDRIFSSFADKFEDEFISQREYEERGIIGTLDRAWELLRILPRQELKRVREEQIKKYLDKEETKL